MTMTSQSASKPVTRSVVRPDYAIQMFVQRRWARNSEWSEWEQIACYIRQLEEDRGNLIDMVRHPCDRDAVLEEVAKVCDEWAASAGRGGYLKTADITQTCASNIRAMKSKPPADPVEDLCALFDSPSPYISVNGTFVRDLVQRIREQRKAT